MSHTVDGARSMVRTARKTGKLLQIGYQRRSNPRYRHVGDKLLGEARLTGRLMHVAGHCNLPVRDDIGWPRRFAMKDRELELHGYSSMHEFRNWRSFKRFSAGRFSDFGGHQIDVIRWCLGLEPRSVVASGGTDYYEAHESNDNVLTILELASADGIVRAMLQVRTTTSGDGELSSEHFLGTEGSIKMSENPRWTKVYREVHAPDWDRWVSAGLLRRPPDAAGTRPETSEEVAVRETGSVIPYDLPVVLDQSVYQPHLENFFAAVRGRAELNCPDDDAFRTEVIVHKVEEAVATAAKVTFTPEDFAV